MTLRLAIFDVDGTLIDSLGHIMASATRAFAEVGLAPPARDEVRPLIGLSLPLVIERLCPEHPELVDRIVAGYKAAFAEYRAAHGIDGMPLFPGIAEVLATLNAQADTLLGVATGKSRRGLDAVLDAHDLHSVFVTCQVADHHPSKPHPAMVEAALSEAGVEPGQAIMIGDTTFDIEMSRAAGVRAIGVSWGYHSSQALRAAGAELVVEEAPDLVGALDGMWAG